ncbi:hypothetical protein KI387_042477 [Taxus chinensis]|uniref:Uncharacterized protein n=1 Tax=Taxus chinensis TaxID=29808 RepID=A0AA38C7P7_TAXCH|nr:hypothetical protein KI387_042477 [Taxus chinensis]
MELASDGDLRAKLYKLGRRLKRPSLEKSVLFITLEEVASCLCLLEQSDFGTMFSVLDPLVAHLARSDLLGHEEVDVRLLVVTCISEITRIAAPSLPYDDITMEEIYELMVGSFQKLWDTTNPHFGKRVKILKNMAKVRSCIPMLDLNCEDLISHMFEVFFGVLHEDHSHEIMDAMQTIMTLMLNEYEEPPHSLLVILVEELGQKKPCIAHTLARRVVEQCSSKIKSCIQGMGSLVFDDEILASNDCMKLSGCKDLFDEHEGDIGVKHMHDKEEQKKISTLHIEKTSLQCLEPHNRFWGQPMHEEKNWEPSMPWRHKEETGKVFLNTCFSNEFASCAGFEEIAIEDTPNFMRRSLQSQVGLQMLHPFDVCHGITIFGSATSLQMHDLLIGFEGKQLVLGKGGL